MADELVIELDVADEAQLREAEERVRAERRERMNALGASLQAEFDRRCNLRQPQETRWLEDLRQYNGQYDPKVLAEIRKNEGSELFVNLTRSKADAVEARIGDLLLPTDDRNWDVKPTPMPELADLQNLAQTLFKTPQGNEVTSADMAQAIRAVAEDRCRRMRDVIDDQLAEARYNATVRDIIHDGCVLGVGVLKGPVIQSRMRKRWDLLKDDRGNVARTLKLVPDRKPAAVRVDPWHFYPQPGVSRIEDSESEYERHLLSRQAVRDLAKQPGFDAEAIKEALRNHPDAPNVNLDFRIQLRAIAGDTSSQEVGYELVEYSGPIEPRDLEAAGIEVPDDDPLEAYYGNIWFMYGVVVKAELSLMETGYKPYKTWNYAKDDTSIFGRGVPRQMRTSQAMANAAIRMMFDNAGLAVGGQLIYAPGAVVPADGNPRMTPRKTWQTTELAADVRTVFNIVDIPLHIEWLQPLFMLTMRLADEESQLPLIAQGSQEQHITKTRGGMAMLFEAASVMLRRTVKEFDDGITVPFIGDMYDWNMQFHHDENIKGDFSVIARGASALAEREQQLQGFLQFLQFLNANPVFQRIAQWDKIAEEGARLMRINRGSLLKSPEQVMQIIKEIEANPAKPQPDPRLEIAKIDAETDRARMALEKAMHDDSVRVQMEKIALDAGMTMDQFTQRLGLDRMRIDSENQRFNSEMTAKVRLGSGI